MILHSRSNRHVNSFRLPTPSSLFLSPAFTHNSDVGTGLLLGGGLSYLSAGHGFSVDALVEADVVLVNGALVTATATNRYSDLFKALKVHIDSCLSGVRR